MLFGKKDKPVLPETADVSAAPYVKNTGRTYGIMLDVIVALLPAAAWGVYVFGPRALCIMTISVVCSVLFEFLFRLILRRKCSVGDLSAVVTGMLIGMNLPASAPYWAPAAGAFAAIVAVKQLFGGIGRNYVNPALAGIAVLRLLPAWLDRFPAPFDKPDWKCISLAGSNYSAFRPTPVEVLTGGAAPDVPTLDLFLGKCGGTIGGVSVLMLLLGGLYLLSRGVISWSIPLSFVGSAAVLSVLFPVTGDRLGSVTCEVLCGGLLLGAFFMATDYSTSPVTDTGKIIYGIGCGVLTFLARRYVGGNEGVFIAILIMNLPVRLIDKLTMPRVFGTGKNDPIPENIKKKDDKNENNG